MLHVVYAGEKPPNSFSKSMFLAGPTPRSAEVPSQKVEEVPSWRPEALVILEKKKYDGVVFVPEDRPGAGRLDYEIQTSWERRCLDMADCVLFWVPRNLKTMPALTTNIEFGLYERSAKAVFGAPLSADKNKYLIWSATKASIPQATTLEETIDTALKYIGDGALRAGTECLIPLHVWKTKAFQSWYKNLADAGNKLIDARVEFVRKGKGGNWIYLWVLWVDIYVASEKRREWNEIVISRPDIFSTVAYRRAKNILDYQIVLVKEFRSPGSTKDGFVWELPGGSSFEEGLSPAIIAAKEFSEETGLIITAHLLKDHEVRQLVGTLSAHKAHVFSYELTDNELWFLKAQKDTPHGEPGSGETGEQTYVEIKTVREILGDSRIDWSNVGMILSVLRPQ